MTLDGEAEAVYEMLCAEGFVKESVELDPDAVLDYLSPIIEPARADEFTFTRGWMRSQAARIADPGPRRTSWPSSSICRRPTC